MLQTVVPPAVEDNSQPVLGGLSIGEAAAVSGLTVDALRYYEREGLTLHPLDRNSAGRRRYFERDISWIRALAMLRRTGMRIRDVRAFTELSREAGTEPERLAVLEEHRDRVIDRIAVMQLELEEIQSKIEFYRGTIPS
ncbi:DNA-binding transcriptional MerR regulator [Conyzicola nivalis]|uniref:DNA-binding transcriptional MerR regulator n=1 Tax=Conyzicola nivalis TaxID=1477021 RepID=A0ABV2QP73_9MICO